MKKESSYKRQRHVIPPSKLQRFNPDNCFNLKVTSMQIKFWFCHFSRLMSLKIKLASITWHVLNFLADLRSASTSKCCFPFLDVSPWGKTLIFPYFFVCLKQRSSKSLSEESVNMFKCTTVSKQSYVLIRLPLVPSNGFWHIEVHFTASEFLLLANRRCINFVPTYKTTTVFHDFVEICRAEKSVTFKKNLKFSNSIFL